MMSHMLNSLKAQIFIIDIVNSSQKHQHFYNKTVLNSTGKPMQLVVKILIKLTTPETRYNAVFE